MTFNILPYTVLPVNIDQVTRYCYKYLCVLVACTPKYMLPINEYIGHFNRQFLIALLLKTSPSIPIHDVIVCYRIPSILKKVS